jgi:hypothetical protein
VASVLIQDAAELVAADEVHIVAVALDGTADHLEHLVGIPPCSPERGDG